MGSGASAAEKYKGKTVDELKDALQKADPADRARWAAAHVEAISAEKVTCNRAKTTENEANIHLLHLTVMENKQAVYKERSMIDGNRALIMKNYASAFAGNRQMANINTDDIYKNRMAILDALKPEGEVQENFRCSSYNEASIEYINHRCLLNNRVAKVNVMMSAINDKLIDVNSDIMKGNEEVVAFNGAQIETNTKLLDAGILDEKCTPDANEARANTNKANIDKILERNNKYNAEAENRVKLIEENTKNIIENAKEIDGRRKKIEENSAGIRENGKKVVELLKAQSIANEVVAVVKGMDDADKANLAAALDAPAPPTAEAVKLNQKQIAENEAKLHQLHLDVMTNKEKLYGVRSLVEQNRAKILENYSAAFVANRQIANQNTDDIFKNRTAVFDLLTVDTPSKENFSRSKYNESNIQYLEHRSLLNNRVAKVNQKMAGLGTELIAVNTAIMQSNEEIVNFNAAAIAANKVLLEGTVMKDATPESNAVRIKTNTEKIDLIASKVGKYDTSCDDMLKKAIENRDTKISANSKIIRERRQKIKENRKLILENGAKIAEKIRGA